MAAFRNNVTQKPIVSNYQPNLQVSALSPDSRMQRSYAAPNNDNEITFPQNHPVYGMDCVSNAPLSYSVTSLERCEEDNVGGMLNANYMAIAEGRRAAEEKASKERKIKDFRLALKARLIEQKKRGKIKTKAQMAREIEEEKIKKYEKKKAILQTRR